MKNDSAQSFFSLSPQLVLDCIENALEGRDGGFRASGSIFALNSIENRVYEIEELSGEKIVAKFYRPYRWTNEQILEEHSFCHTLLDADLPVLAPLRLFEGKDIELLGNTGASHSYLAEGPDGLRFSIYPKISGRLRDELDASAARKCGHYLAQMHNIGEGMGESTRRTLNTENFIHKPLALLLESEHMPADYQSIYQNYATKIESIAREKLSKYKTHRIHGDCHCGNIIWSFDGEPLFVDFDDMMLGPAAQDLWMILRGRDALDEANKQEFLNAYNFFRDFEMQSLELIECLRAMRMIHYSAWIAERWSDPSFPKNFPTFDTPSYWQEEVEALRDVLERIC